MATGRLTGVAVTRPPWPGPQTARAVMVFSSVSPELSATVPVTRTLSPNATLLVVLPS